MRLSWWENGTARWDGRRLSQVRARQMEWCGCRLRPLEEASRPAQRSWLCGGIAMARLAMVAVRAALVGSIWTGAEGGDLDSTWRHVRRRTRHGL
jgi:hypothetical protein